MKTKLMFLIFGILIFNNLLYSQVDTGKVEVNKNAIFIELGGTGLLYSANYERDLIKIKNTIISFRLGAAPFFNGNGSLKEGQIFGLMNLRLGVKKTKFEIGIGYDNIFNFDTEITYREYKNGYINTEKSFITHPTSPYNGAFTSNISLKHELKKYNLFYKISFISIIPIERDGYGKVYYEYFPWAGFSFGKMF